MKKSFIFILFLLVVNVYYFSNGLFIVHADAIDSIDSLSEEYTNSDIYYYGDEEININDYKSTWCGYDISRGPGYGQRYYTTQEGIFETYGYLDNDIVNIIPKDLFFMNIEYHYIGKEYGFYIKTVNLGSEHYRSDVIVYDIVYDIPDSRIVDSSPVETSCGINVLFTCYYDGITSNTPDFNRMLPSWLDKAVTYLSTSDNLYLNNISIGLELQNKYDLNPGDPDYDIYNDDLTLKDEGDFITLQKIFVKPKVLPDKTLQSKNELTESEQFILIKLKKILKDTKVLSPLLYLEYLDIKFLNSEGILDEDETENDCFSVQTDFKTGSNQALEKHKLIRYAESSTESNYDNYNAQIFTGGSVEVTTTLQDKMEPTKRNIMLANYNIKVNVVNKSSSLSATTSRTFTYSLEKKAILRNGIASSFIEPELDFAAFVYKSNANENLYINSISNNNTIIKLYNTDGTLAVDGLNTLTYYFQKNKNYYIYIYGNDNAKILLSLNSTNYNYKQTYIQEKKQLNCDLEEFATIIAPVDYEDLYIFALKLYDVSCANLTITDLETNNILVDKYLNNSLSYLLIYIESNKFYLITIRTVNNNPLGLLDYEIVNSSNNVYSYSYNTFLDLHNSLNDSEIILYKTIRYINSRGAGFVNINLSIKDLNNNDVLLNEGSIVIYNSDKSSIINKYNVYDLAQKALSDQNVNDLCVYLPSDGYYYIVLMLPKSEYSKVEFNLKFVEYQKIDFIDKIESEFILNLLSNDKKGDYIRSFEIVQAGNFELEIILDSLSNKKICNVILFREVYNNSTNTYLKYDKLALELYNSVTMEMKLIPGKYYIGYFNNINEVSININIKHLLIDNSNRKTTLLTDPSYASSRGILLGSEVLLNDGEYNGNTITEGFTRYLYFPIDFQPSESRIDYYWYSTNSNIAMVSQYGTVLAKNVIVDRTVTIYAVNKNNPSLIFSKEFVIKKETKTSSINIQLSMNIPLNQITYINLENSAPYNFLQYYSWQSVNENIATVDNFGRVLGKRRGTVNIIGSDYIYNNRVTIKIIVSII